MNYVEVLDVGCGAGQHALWFQDWFNTLAVDVSPRVVRVAAERGVNKVAVMDMFDGLGIPRNSFQTVHCVGTQGTLAKSDEVLADLQSVKANAPGSFGRPSVFRDDERASLSRTT